MTHSAESSLAPDEGGHLGPAFEGAAVAPRRRWVILALGWAAMAAMSCYVYGVAMLVPAIRATYDVSLALTGLVVAAPGLGVLLTLFAWGYTADRFGERRVIVLGLACATGFLAGACFARGLFVLCVLLTGAGAAGAAVNAASGRLVMGWFAIDQRGFAMGVRQTAQPLGVGMAALTLPVLAHHDLHAAFALPAAVCAVVAALVFAFAADPRRDPSPPDEHTRSPYRAPVLWRLHAASTLLVVPQFAVSVFLLEYLVNQRHWPVLEAGRLVFATQVAGAAGRVVVGLWSDRVGSRLRPMRQIAVASMLTMAAVAAGDAAHSWLVVVAFAAGAVVSVTDNGLGVTAAAEIAGPVWAGRALGAQNTAQNLAAMLTPPLLGVLIQASSYAWGFVVAAVFPMAAIVVTPVGRRARG